jgi:hypothetical protein
VEISLDRFEASRFPTDVLVFAVLSPEMNAGADLSYEECEDDDEDFCDENGCYCGCGCEDEAEEEK